MAKYVCLSCGWKGDDPKEDGCAKPDIRLAKPNYPKPTPKPTPTKKP